MNSSFIVYLSLLASYQVQHRRSIVSMHAAKNGFCTVKVTVMTLSARHTIIWHSWPLRGDGAAPGALHAFQPATRASLPGAGSLVYSVLEQAPVTVLSSG